MLDEMDIALADEIKAQGSVLSKRVAINGKSKGEQNGLYLYDFSLQTHWTPQDDTPVIIRVSNTSRVTGTIIKAAGMGILVSFEKPLTQGELQRLDIYSDSTELTKRLREALKQAKEGEHQLASKCFKLRSFRSGTREPKNIFTTFELDDYQKKAASIAFGSEVSYIIGPPGTGKTHTLAAIAYAFMNEGRSILIAAHTNIAADNAIKSLVKSCAEKNLALHEGQAVRFGVTDTLQDPIYEKAYVPAIIKKRTSVLGKRKEEIIVRLEQISKAKVKVQKEEEQALPGWNAQRSQYLAQCELCKTTMAPLQLSEQARVAALNRQMQQAESKLRNTQHDIENIKLALSQAVQQHTQLKWITKLHVSNTNTLEAALTEAQQMHRIKRLFKGINIEKISDDVAQAKHAVWQDEQNINALQSRIQVLHTEQSRLENLVNLHFQEYKAVQYQITLPSSDEQKIAQLQTEITQLEVLLAQGDENQKQQNKQSEAKERLYKDEVHKLEEEQTSIDKQLQDIEKKIVAEAQIVATTLSKVYMNSALAERQFDVVIMDEVSMAPLPAAYIVACHANTSVIALGDPQQLSPILQAKTEVAEKWLGKSLFDHNSLTLVNAASSGYGNSAILKNQSRMHPDIAIVSSKHVYKNELYNSDRVVGRPPNYIHVAPLPGKYLLLCDTSDANPIATKPEGRSRINIYNALCTLAIARQVLYTQPPLENGQSDAKRIGIITPYAKQAELYNRLVADAGLGDYIHSGTVHRFQGLEFDVIIFDTVDSGTSKPREGFIKGGYGSNAMRLVNVAITRARHKLIIVANSAYINAKFDENDTLRLTIEHAKRNTIFSNAVLNNILATRPETQVMTGIQIRDENIVAQQFRLPPKANTFFEEFKILTEETFFNPFERDVQNAKIDIIVVSPFLAEWRTSSLLSLLQKKLTDGIKVLVITKPLNEQNVKTGEVADQMLKNASIDVQYQSRLHEKIAIIDKQIVYSGSLNILSHSNTSEVMVRLNSQKFAEEIGSLIGFSNSTKSYKKSETTSDMDDNDITISCNELPKLKCACGCDMRAIVGKFGPFYGCVNYTKCTQKDKNINVSQEHLSGVSRLTNVSCVKCSSSTPMLVKANRRNAWLECSNSTSCNYKQNIVILRS